jgi:phosphoserine phosphatase
VCSSDLLGNQKLEINKFKILKESLYSENKINSCFGDSESDYELLKHATFKYAINPTSKLSKLISQKEVDIQVINPEEAYLYFKKDH